MDKKTKNQNKDYNYKAMKYESYIKKFELYNSSKLEQSKIFDKTIVTLSAGALGLSMTFIHQIAPNMISSSKIFLILAWTCFTLCLVSNLFAMQSSQKACDRQLTILTFEYRSKKDGGQINRKNFSLKLTKFLNSLSILFFLAGVILLGIFIIINIL